MINENTLHVQNAQSDDLAREPWVICLRVSARSTSVSSFHTSGRSMQQRGGSELAVFPPQVPKYWDPPSQGVSVDSPLAVKGCPITLKALVVLIHRLCYCFAHRSIVTDQPRKTSASFTPSRWTSSSNRWTSSCKTAAPNSGVWHLEPEIWPEETNIPQSQNHTVLEQEYP